MSVALIRDGVIRPSENDSHVLTAMLPSSCPQNHAANILPLPDGALMCVWFAGTQEGIADISVWGSRLPAGGMQWSDAVKLSHDDTRSEQNPVLFLAPDNVLWLLWTAQISGNQDTAIVRYRKSDDLGQTWGEIATLLDKPGTFIRQPITVLDNGNWLLPVFYCRTQPGEKWVGNDDISAVKISADGGHSARCRGAAKSRLCSYEYHNVARRYVGCSLSQPLGRQHLYQPFSGQRRELVGAASNRIAQQQFVYSGNDACQRRTGAGVQRDECGRRSRTSRVAL